MVPPVGIEPTDNTAFEAAAFANSATAGSLAESGGFEPLGVTRPRFSGPLAGHSAALSLWRREQGSNLRRCYPDSGLANRCLATRPPLRFELSDSGDELIRPPNLVGAEGFEPSKVAPKATVFASYTMPPKLWWGVQVSNLPLASEHGVTARSSRQCRSHPIKQKGRPFRGGLCENFR